ncbi:MAG TPA: EF-hand domain-containing protein [Polyangiaceae bacterium]|jgi:Ca2+-binding EF-hand superfamily protein|nr:EF-hand domain-containing protein [Polyangiaceae bacterium]
MKRALILSLAALPLLVTSVAAAHERHEGGREGHGPGGRHFFAHLDANGDGKITKAEALDGAAKHFSELDANKDGSVSPEEAAQGMGMGHRPDFDPAKFFARLDANNDGKLVADEVKHMPKERFAEVDTNHDGALTLAEFEAQAKQRKEKHAEHKDERFGRVDTNHDGKWSLDEMKAMATNMFTHADKNADGVITRDEFARHPAP